MALTRANIISEVYRLIDESSGSSYFSDADIIAYINRETEKVGTGFPVRLAAFPIRGDGTRQDFTIPEPLYGVIAMEEGNTFTPPRTFVDVIGAGGLRTTLTRDLFSSYGFSFRPPDRIRVEETLSSGDTRTLWAYGVPGYVNAATISSSTVTATNASITITAAQTVTSLSSTVHLDTIQVTDSDGNVDYYIVDKTSGVDTIVLTETYKGNTDAACSISIGAHTYLTEDWMDYLVFSVVRRLNLIEQNYESADHYKNEVFIDRRRRRANLARIARLGSERFQSF